MASLSHAGVVTRTDPDHGNSFTVIGASAADVPSHVAW